MRWAFLCRLLNDHKWERMRTREEAYRCRRCGKRHYGPIRETDVRRIRDASRPDGPGRAGCDRVARAVNLTSPDGGVGSANLHFRRTGAANGVACPLQRAQAQESSAQVGVRQGPHDLLSFAGGTRSRRRAAGGRNEERWRMGRGNFVRPLACLIGRHEWTSRVERGRRTRCARGVGRSLGGRVVRRARNRQHRTHRPEVPARPVPRPL